MENRWGGWETCRSKTRNEHSGQQGRAKLLLPVGRGGGGQERSGGAWVARFGHDLLKMEGWGLRWAKSAGNHNTCIGVGINISQSEGGPIARMIRLVMPTLPDPQRVEREKKTN